MDYLPIQASSVPCERVFSSSAETDTVRRNRLTPVMFEALQMTKYAIWNDLMDFTSQYITPESDLVPRSAGTRALLGSLANKHHSELQHEDIMDRVVRNLLREG